MTVVRRSGKIGPLTKKKICEAICNANMATAEENRITKKQITRITDTIFAVCEDMEDPIGIDMLEDALPQELAEYQGCILKSEKLNGKLIKRFQRNPVYLNF